MLRIGILLPRSTLFPSLGLDILSGLKEQLKQQQVFDDIKLVTDNIGFGTEEQEIYTKAEKMLLQEDADVVILCADTGITEMLQPLFTATNKILLVVNFGANFPESWQSAPTTIIHSLNFCEHAGITGKLAAEENENKEVANLVSYYDGGYRQCYCMLTANQAAGGIPAFYHITSIKRDDFTLEPLAVFLEQQTGIKNLLCLFSGDHAELFYKEIAPLQKKSGLCLYVAPMLLEPSLIRSLKDTLSTGEVKGYVPWHASLDNDGNKEFLKQFSGTAGKQANYFSVLGWEAGSLLTEIYRQHGQENSNAIDSIAALTRITFKSPRGWLKIDPSTLHSYGPSYLARCRNNMDITIESEANSEEEWRSFTSQRTLKGEASGWRNTYLCI